MIIEGYYADLIKRAEEIAFVLMVDTGDAARSGDLNRLEALEHELEVLKEISHKVCDIINRRKEKKET